MDHPNRPDFPGEEAYYHRYGFESKLSERRPFWRRHLGGGIAALSLVLVIASAWMTFAFLGWLSFPSLPTFTKPKPRDTSNSMAGPVHAGLPCAVNINTWTDGSPDWIVHNGVLYNDGSNEKPTRPTIIAPCQPDVSNYAVEAQIQLTNQVSGCFGIVLRTSYATAICNSQYSGPPDTAYVSYTSDTLTNTPFTPGATSHTYRAEVRDNIIKLFIDNSLVTTAKDNRLLTSDTSGQVGLFSQQLQLQVTSLRVTALS